MGSQEPGCVPMYLYSPFEEQRTPLAFPSHSSKEEFTRTSRGRMYLSREGTSPMSPPPSLFSLYNLQSLVGAFILLGIAWLFSRHRRAMNWRVVGWGMGMQALIAVFIFNISVGARFFNWLNDHVILVLNCSKAGTEFVFGYLAAPDDPSKFSLAISLATIVFFSALVAVLYYTGIIPLIVRAMAWVFTRLMRVSGAEALCAGSNFFVGIESALTVRPYLKDMTRSELCTVLAAGMATVASNVLCIYIGALHDIFPAIAGHLISASLLSVPAAVVMSKMLLPETEKPVTLGQSVEFHYEREATLFEAVINGANGGVKLIVGIAALLIAVLGLVALVDLILGGVGGWVNSLTGAHIHWSLVGLLGYVCRPFAFILGVPWSDARLVGDLIAQRAIMTEIPAYTQLATLMKEGAFQNPRSPVVAAYALCGFAHVASMAIFVGGVAALAPERRGDLARLGPRALAAATMACLLTGAVAGVFYTPGAAILTP